MIHVLNEGQFGMPSVDGESFYFSPSSTGGTLPAGAKAGGDASGGGGGRGDGDAGSDAGSGLKLIRLEEVRKR